MRLQSKCKARCWKASILPLIRNLLTGRRLGRLRFCVAWERDRVGGREVNREAGEARRGHGCAVPLQGQDAAFGLGALKRRPYNSKMRPSAWASLKRRPYNCD